MTIDNGAAVRKLPMRERILAAAPDVLRRFTLTKFTMDDVARAAGIARQTIYKHFASRDDLLVAMVIQDLEQRQFAELLDVIAKPASAENLIDIFLTELEVGGRYPLFQEMFAPNIAPRIAELIFHSEGIGRAREQTWTPILRRYIENGVVRPDLDIPSTVRWITYQLFWLVTHPAVLTDDKDELRMYVGQFILGGILVPPKM